MHSNSTANRIEKTYEILEYSRIYYHILLKLLYTILQLQTTHKLGLNFQIHPKPKHSKSAEKLSGQTLNPEP